MRHPSSRGERRAVRVDTIARRMFVVRNIWRLDDVDEWFTPRQGRYSKHNLGCGCCGCHYLKYFGPKRKRRRALDQAIFDNLRSFDVTL